jgi:hypothetical protein
MSDSFFSGFSQVAANRGLEFLMSVAGRHAMPFELFAHKVAGELVHDFAGGEWLYMFNSETSTGYLKPDSDDRRAISLDGKTVSVDSDVFGVLVSIAAAEMIIHGTVTNGVPNEGDEEISNTYNRLTSLLQRYKESGALSFR